MSQQKVESYKRDKQNRKNEMKKEKLQRNIIIAVAAVILLAVIGWAGYSIYSKIDTQTKSDVIDVNLDAINNYTSSLNQE